MALVFVIDAAEKKHPDEWFGFWSGETGELAYYDTKFSKAVKTPDSLIIIKNFDSISGYVANQLMDLFQGSRRKVCVYPPYWPSRTYFHNTDVDWIYGCSKGVKFWLLGTSKTDISWMNQLIGNPLIEHME